ncbi:TPA: hypothetical protein ACGW8Q_005722 [Bacillus cereus]|uniref:hypothetical protein n=1 Tax=Bacillus cereus group TaxID=86661 RepID=UPI0022E62576|nr:hypothetical protein [Bacillus mobilis]
MRCISCDEKILGKGYFYNQFYVCSHQGKCLYELQVEGVEELIHKKERWIRRFKGYIKEIEGNKEILYKNKWKKEIVRTEGMIQKLEESMGKLKNHPDVRLKYLFK